MKKLIILTMLLVLGMTWSCGMNSLSQSTGEVETDDSYFVRHSGLDFLPFRKIKKTTTFSIHRGDQFFPLSR